MLQLTTVAITVGENDKPAESLKEKSGPKGLLGSGANTYTGCAHARKDLRRPELSLLAHLEALNKQEVKTKVEDTVPA